MCSNDLEGNQIHVYNILEKNYGFSNDLCNVLASFVEPYLVHLKRKATKRNQKSKMGPRRKHYIFYYNKSFFLIIGPCRGAEIGSDGKTLAIYELGLGNRVKTIRIKDILKRENRLDNYTHSVSNV